MNLSDFDYDLPESYIAQTPVEPRDASRLMVVDRQTGTVAHRRFRDLGEYVRPGDVLVFNDTRVILARLMARKQDTGGKAEILMLVRRAPLMWEVLVGGKGLHTGTVFDIDGHSDLHAVVLEELEGSRRVIQFSQPVTPLLNAVGHVPLPPYIHTPLADPERYQTVYAHQPGSAAAPTAGLHFTPQLLDQLKAAGVICAYVTLHVGLDTFQPVTEDDPSTHAMHGEWCDLPEATAEAVNAAKREGRRVIAVGTTSVRVLESGAKYAREGETAGAFADFTHLFILPGYQFKVVDALITNFHLPKSTLLMLVSAFAGRGLILSAYETAKREHYRFYSFGDALALISPD